MKTKKLAIITILLLGFSMNSQAQIQDCENRWNTVKKVDSKGTWNEQNTISNGKVFWKSITFNNDYVYKLYKVASTGYFYVQDHGFEKMTYYSNEKDAIRALYIYAGCAGYFTEQGKLKQ